MNKETQKVRKSILDQLLDERSLAETRKNKDKMFLAVRIADLIKERNLSKSAFAVLMDQKPSVVSKWLSGTHNYTLETLSEIAFKLGLSLAELMQEKREAVKTVYQNSFDVSTYPPYLEQGLHDGKISINLYRHGEENNASLFHPPIIHGIENPFLVKGVIWEKVVLQNYDTIRVAVYRKSPSGKLDQQSETGNDYKIKA